MRCRRIRVVWWLFKKLLSDHILSSKSWTMIRVKILSLSSRLPSLTESINMRGYSGSWSTPFTSCQLSACPSTNARTWTDLMGLLISVRQETSIQRQDGTRLIPQTRVNSHLAPTKSPSRAALVELLKLQLSILNSYLSATMEATLRSLPRIKVTQILILTQE